MICASTFLSSSGLIALTLPCVPTGMKTGVSTQPCRVVNRPSRARDFGSVLRSWKDILGTETEYVLCSTDSRYSNQRGICSGWTRQSCIQALRRRSGWAFQAEVAVYVHLNSATWSTKRENPAES